ncbi:MAG: DUF4416 family protein, partial [Pseudomonadota bacterium]
MSSPKPPQPVKLIVSILTSEHDLAAAAGEQLKLRFGPADFISPELAFTFTDYYEKEIGKNLFRHFITYAELISPEALPSIKLYTNGLEETLARQDGTRRINIDPGYIALWHLILATCKRFAHRPYLRDGVYADLTLLFQGKTFKSLPWTFPDYGSAEIISLLNTLREQYYK